MPRLETVMQLTTTQAAYIQMAGQHSRAMRLHAVKGCALRPELCWDLPR